MLEGLRRSTESRHLTRLLQRNPEGSEALWCQLVGPSLPPKSPSLLGPSHPRPGWACLLVESGSRLTCVDLSH